MASDAISQNVVQAFKDYKWYNSLSLPIEVQVGISRLELPSDMHVSSLNSDGKYNSDQCFYEDIYFTAYIICNQICLHETPVSTHFSRVDDYHNALIWDYILTFPVKMRDLSLDSVLVLTAWTSNGEVFGGTSLRFFDENGNLRRGKQKLMFYFNTKGDGNVITNHNLTPGHNYDNYSKYDYKFSMEKNLETYKAGFSNLKEANQLEWLDSLLLNRIQNSFAGSSLLINEENLERNSNSFDRSAEPDLLNNWGSPLEEYDLKTFCFLIVEMPMFLYPVLHEEKQYPTVSPHWPPTKFDYLSACITEMDDYNIEFSLVGMPFNAASLTVVADWDMEG
eukprot:gene15353-20688_t